MSKQNAKAMLFDRTCVAPQLTHSRPDASASVNVGEFALFISHLTSLVHFTIVNYTLKAFAHAKQCLCLTPVKTSVHTCGMHATLSRRSLVALRQIPRALSIVVTTLPKTRARLASARLQYHLATSSEGDER